MHPNDGKVGLEGAMPELWAYEAFKGSTQCCDQLKGFEIEQGGKTLHLVEPSYEGHYFAAVDAGVLLGPMPLASSGFGFNHGTALLDESSGSMLERISRVGLLKHVRFHGMLDFAGASRERDEDWETVDRVFDKVVELGWIPVVELGPAPKGLFRSNGGSKALEKDDARWRELVGRYVTHLAERYGHERLRGWHFQALNEPDLFPWKPFAHPFLYSRVYASAASAVKSVDPAFRMGGAEIAGHTHFLHEFLRCCSAMIDPVTGHQGLPLDFVSFHIYTNSPNREPCAAHLGEKIREVRSVVSLFPQFKDLPFLVNEWGPVWGGGLQAMPTGFYNDHYFCCFVCKALKTFLDENIASNIVWGGLEAMWEHGASTRKKEDFDGTRSLITRSGIPRPAFAAFELWNQLGPDRLLFAKGANAFRFDGVACAGDASVQVLLWHHEDRVHIDSGQKIRVHLDIRNIPFGPELQIQDYRVNAQHNNTHTLFQKGKTAAALLEFQPVAVEKKISIQKGALSQDIDLSPHEVCLLVFRPLSGKSS